MLSSPLISHLSLSSPPLISPSRLSLSSLPGVPARSGLRPLTVPCRALGCWRCGMASPRRISGAQTSGHLSHQGPSPWIAQFRWVRELRPALGVLVVPNFFSLRIIQATVLLGTVNAAEFFCHLPQICASTQSCL